MTAVSAVRGVLFAGVWLSVTTVGAVARSADDPPRTGAPGTSPAQEDAAIDFTKARALQQKQQRGEKLTDEEAAYLQKARAARQAGGQPPRAGQGPRPKVEAGPGQTSVELVPLTDLGSGTYKGQTGGLYGDGLNTPPQSQLDAALAAAKLVQPLDAEGRPDPAGKIVLLSSGMSNTTQEFSKFVEVANADPEKSSRLVIVDGAFGGMDAADWANVTKRYPEGRPGPWEQQSQRLSRAGVTPQQVQVLWIKQALKGPGNVGEFPTHAEKLKNDLADVVREMRRRFPNLRLCYLSSRTYAGYAGTALNPEPFAYEGAFSTRWLIQDQIAGKGDLNADPSRGAVQAPVLLWGPYLWSNGEKGREIDDLKYTRADFGPDGTHPSESGRAKVAAQLLHYFKTDATARSWFVGQ
jgi:hypothetical protein